MCSPNKPTYFYPQDVKVSVKDGIRVGEVDWSLPVKWTDAAKHRAKTCYFCGWEMARRAHEKIKQDEWFKRVYPQHYKEMEEDGRAFAKGATVSMLTAAKYGRPGMDTDIARNLEANGYWRPSIPKGNKA